MGARPDHVHFGNMITQANQIALTWLTYIGCGISLAALVLALVIFTYLRSLSSDRIFIHKNLVVALIISNILFIGGVGHTQNKIACKIVAIFLHYFYLSVFSWMLVEGFHLYSMVVKVFGSETSKWKQYLVLGWTFPFFVVAVTTAVDHNGYGSERGCWLTIENGFIWAFVGPAAGIIVVNTVIICMVLRIIIQSTQTHNSDIKDQAKAGVKGAILLFPLLGLTWTFGILSVNSGTLAFQYLFTIFNSLQGLFVFVFHCLMNSEVRQAWIRKREQRMLSKGGFDSGFRSTVALNATSSSKDMDVPHFQYTLDHGDVHASGFVSVENKTSRSKDHVAKDSEKPRHPAKRMAKSPRKPIPRCDTPLEDILPGTVLEDSDHMKEVKVTHRIIENDDWKVEESRHVTRKVTRKANEPDNDNDKTV